MCDDEARRVDFIPTHFVAVVDSQLASARIHHPPSTWFGTLIWACNALEDCNRNQKCKQLHRSTCALGTHLPSPSKVLESHRTCTHSIAPGFILRQRRLVQALHQRWCRFARIQCVQISFFFGLSRLIDLVPYHRS